MMTRNRFINEQYRICLISFEQLLHRIEHDLINDLHEYKLLKNHKVDLRNQDTKKIIYHHIIYQICKSIISYKSRYKMDVVVVYDGIFDKCTELCDYIDCDTFYDQLIKLLKSITKNIPINLYCNPDTIDYNYFSTGEGIDFMNLINEDIQSHRVVNFDKIKKFTNKYDLIFLTNSFFNKVNSVPLL